MHLRYRFIVTLALCCSLFAGIAAAQKPAVAPESIGQVTEVKPIKLGIPMTPSVACRLGETGSPAWFIDYFLPPDDSYLTLIDPTTCFNCNPQNMMLTTAHVLLNYRIPCSMDVTVSIVGAVNVGGGCYEPNPDQLICAPIDYTLSAPAAGNWDFSLALPAGCCINQPAFLKVTVNSLGTCPDLATTRPRLITTATCIGCESWNIYPPAFVDELCSVGFPGNPIMNVDAFCCQVTPTQKGTWGSVKKFYR